MRAGVCICTHKCLYLRLYIQMIEEGQKSHLTRSINPALTTRLLDGTKSHWVRMTTPTLYHGTLRCKIRDGGRTGAHLAARSVGKLSTIYAARLECRISCAATKYLTGHWTRGHLSLRYGYKYVNCYWSGE